MTADERREERVEFRKAASDKPAGKSVDDREPGSPESKPTRRHVLRGVEQEGVCPPHLELFSEESVDGFPTEKPNWVAFCPDCGAKLTLEEHEACPFFGGREVDENGFVVAVHCGLVEPEDQ